MKKDAKPEGVKLIEFPEKARVALEKFQAGLPAIPHTDAEYLLKWLETGSVLKLVRGLVKDSLYEFKKCVTGNESNKVPESVSSKTAVVAFIKGLNAEYLADCVNELRTSYSTPFPDENLNEFLAERGVKSGDVVRVDLHGNTSDCTFGAKIVEYNGVLAYEPFGGKAMWFNSHTLKEVSLQK